MSLTAATALQPWVGMAFDSVQYTAPHMFIGTTARAYPAADLALYIPVHVPRAIVCRKFFAAVGTSAGNIDLGVYTAAGLRVASTGPQALATTTDEAVFDVTDFTLYPGGHYLAVTCSSTSATLIADNDAAPLHAANGLLSEASVSTLPTTATWSRATTVAYWPLIGIFVEATAA